MTIGKSGRKQQSNANKKIKEKIVALLIVILILILARFLGIPLVEEATQTTDVEGQLVLTMIDVGQADSFLLEQDGKTALIDCGTRSTGKNVVKYIQSKGITKIDYLFGTHPHDDHMGGMYDVITSFDIGTIILPEVKAKEVTTSWYIKLMTEIKEGEYNLEYLKEGETYYLSDAIIKVIGTISNPEGNLNNYSPILKVSFGEMDIIMTGDAETEVEKYVLENFYKELDAEILKVGHHGSDSSTSDKFLKAISPEYSLISAKVGNKYEHPIKSIMQKLENAGIKVYRTDENGTVEVVITANRVIFSCDPGDYLSGTELEEKENAR